ncbi:MAG TPA: VOC family protein [Actinomycetota bacterium]|nr:VOC family protein [Actinomycetota bacterium]
MGAAMAEGSDDRYDHDGESIGPIAHGQLCYLQIPALDVARSAGFYRAVFSWHVSPPDTGFEAPGIIGQWVTDRPPSPAAGPLGWIFVAGMDPALRAVEDHGGTVVSPPEPDGPVRWLATVADPAGNVVGIVSHGTR